MYCLLIRCAFLFLAVAPLAACHHSSAEDSGTNLRGIIVNQIRSHIRESWGELKGQNFSDEDLAQFHGDKVTSQVTASLRTNKAFIAAVDKVRHMTQEERATYLELCRKPVHKTWAEIGKISRDGQTEAGVQGERELAGEITSLAESILAESSSNAK